MAVGFSHALHHSDYMVCQTKNEQHIHNADIDCSIHHYFSTTNSFNSTYNDYKYDLTFDRLLIFSYQSIFSQISVNSLFKRGPPSIN